MNRETAVAFLAALVGISLVASPVLMADWGEQAGFSTDPVEQSQIDEGVPVLQYENVPPDAQNAVRKAIESPDGHHTVYGREDWPDAFFYSDYISPGQGWYVVVYQGQSYELMTFGGGGFPFVYWLFELPFIVYGLALLWFADQTNRGRTPAWATALAGVLGGAFHLLGPAFDFPVVAPMDFVGLGVLSAIGAVAVVARAIYHSKTVAANGEY